MYVKGYDSSGGAPVGFLVSPLHSDLTQSVRPALLVLLGAVLLVLMIAAVNVTNLLLARGAQRRAEFAMRLAIGASRGRLIRQLLTESLLLSFVGGVLGIAVAQAGVKALIALSPVGLPRANAIQLDLTAFSFGLIITTFVGLIVGLSPALHASRKDPLETIQQNSRSTAGGYHLLRRTLVVSEVALALVLLIGAGLLLRSLHRIFSIDPGFDGSNLLTMQVQESGHRYDADADRNRFFAQALDAVRDVPGVESAAFTSQLPLSGDFETFGVQFEKHPNEMSDAAYRYAVSPDYFQTMHIPLLRGRLLTEQDRVGAPMAVLISVSFAKRMFPNEDPIGHRLRSGPAMGHDELPWATVVGVVGDVKQTSLGFDQPYAFYTTSPQWFWVDTAQSLVVRTHGNAAALVPALRAAIWSVDKDQPIVRVATMEKLLATSEAERHFALILFEVFGIVALILVASGIYGILAGSVTERTREIGIRTALGASRHQILSLILSQGVRLTVCGIAIGIVGALLTSQTLTTLLFGVSHLDPVTYAAVIALLFTVAIIACWIPAWRAAHVDPSITLRAE
jgi:putative ABC transport system permease protein